MRAELLAVGDELLYGEIVNSNAAEIGVALADIGIDLTRSVVVGDDAESIADAVRSAVVRADALILTGGLGPTQDDLTREGLALAAGVPLRRDGELVARLQEWLDDARQARRAGSRQVPDNNYRQADLPEGARWLPNPIGSAPGLRLELSRGAGRPGTVAYALPGVPREMRLMLAESVLPDLAARAGVPAVVVHRTLHTAGMWESEVAAALAPIVDRLDGGRRSNPSVAFLASAGQTRVRLTARARDRDDALRLLAPVEADVRVALGERCYGADGDTLESVVIAALRARAATVAVAESLTGGLVASRLAAVPGASAVLRGGVVAYATDVKASLLGVPRAILDRDGAVASSTAEAMAAGVRERLGATYGVALTGVAGPAPQEGKPVGLVYLGFAGPDGTESRELRFRGDRERIRTHSVVSALDLLRHRLR